VFSQIKKYLSNCLLVAMVLSCSAAIAESQYPEPFESKIIFQDADYISEHAKDNGAEQSSSDSDSPEEVEVDEEVVLAAPSTASTESESSETEIPADDDIENGNYLLALVILAILVGLFLFGNKPPLPSTSVSRYIARRGLAHTGVEKYLFHRGY